MQNGIEFVNVVCLIEEDVNVRLIAPGVNLLISAGHSLVPFVTKEGQLPRYRGMKWVVLLRHYDTSFGKPQCQELAYSACHKRLCKDTLSSRCLDWLASEYMVSY